MFNKFTANSIRTLLALLLSAAAFGLASCSDGSDGPAGNGGGSSTVEHKIGLYIHTGSDLLSRATPPGDYDKGAGYENYIDIAGKDLVVALYNTNDQWLATIDNPVIVPFSETSSSKTYLLEFKITRDLRDALGSSFKVLMLANWRHRYPQLETAGTLPQLFDLVSTADYWIDYTAGLPSWDLSADDKIAMFGVRQCDGITFQSGMDTFIGDLHLLRALAKVEVWDNTDTADQIESISLTRHITKAVPMPKGVTHQDHYVKNSYKDDYVLSPSLPAGTGNYPNETSEPLPLVKNPDNGHYIVYVPEFPNKSRTDDATRCRLKVRYKEYNARDYYVDFKYYSDDAPAGFAKGEYFDILRNYWYQFELRKLAESINVEVQVVPYAHVPLKPGFGLAIPKELVPVYDDNGQLICYFNSENGNYYDKDDKTVIKNPFLIEGNTKDPGTGWDIVRDDNGTFRYFRDPATGKCYDADKNEIPDPDKI